LIFHDKIVIITGASSGIGEACAKAFDKAGAKVVLAARNEAALKQVAQSLKGEHLVVPTDITKESACKHLVEATIAHFGQVDILVNNAGISMRGLFNETKLEVLERVMQVNFWGSVYCTKYALPYLLQTKGSIAVISTTAGFVGLPGRTGYSASKFALHGFFDTLHSEHLKDGLGVSMIFPGFVRSNIRKHALTTEGMEQGESPRDESHMTSPEEVAERVLKAIEKRKRQVLIGLQTKLIWLFRMLLPAWLERQLIRGMQDEKDTPLQ